MTETATRHSCQNYPIDDPKRIEINLHFDEGQLKRLVKGLIPQRMEDKWFIYHEDDWLYFHRSWTGFGIYKARLIKENNSGSIKEFWKESNQNKYGNSNDEKDIETFTFLIARGVLGIDVDGIYSKRNTHTNDDIINKWSNFGNMLYTSQGIKLNEKIKSALFGIAIGDALGVPYEFSSREQMETKPATDMIGYGTYNQPPGTWSDDSSLTFCLAEALSKNEYELWPIAFNFYMWKKNGYWSARGQVFDIGITTSQSIDQLEYIMDKGHPDDLKLLKQQANEKDNGNGSLMRIMPLLFYIHNKPIREQFEITWEVSALTHKHIRAAMACLIYLKIGEHILNGLSKEEAYLTTRSEIQKFWNEINFPTEERLHFQKVVQLDIRDTKEADLKSGGYVIEVLESSIYYFLTRTNYKETVLSIINIGHDTDTSAAIAGGLAGLYYGIENIPTHWIEQIARKKDIEDLAERLADMIARQ